MGKALIGLGVCFGCAYSLINHDLTTTDKFCFVIGFMGGILAIVKPLKTNNKY